MQRRILVADDNPAILDVLRLILEEEHYLVETASNERQVLAARDAPPDLILLDIRMSGADGRDLCQRLKQDEATKDVPIVIISASTDAKSVAQTCGASGFITKPFDIDELLDVVSRAISGAPISFSDDARPGEPTSIPAP